MASMTSAYHIRSAVRTKKMIGIICAMHEEFEAFEESFEEEIVEERFSLTLRAGSIAGAPVQLVVSGIGTTNATIAATLLIERGCTTIIMSGAAGGLGSCEIGDVYASKSCVYHDVDATAFGYALGQVPGEPERFDAPLELVSIAERCGAIQGVIASGNAFVSDPARVAAIRTDFDADAIDMESCAVAHACTKANVDWLIVRGVSDHADREAKDSFEERLELAAKNAASCTIEIIGSLSAR